ncbi:MAG TPA: HAMP domain-containing sensor histidine kinase [Spirochaetia bacterium]|nr:HAMP domain-containing sensor histidine kinase [Spirochaetia bacterium]
MSLRFRFILLILGSAIVPPIVFAIASLVFSVGGVAPDGGSGVFVTRDLVQEIQSGHASVQSLVEAIEDEGFEPEAVRTELTSVLIVGADGLIRYPFDRSGEPVRVEELLTPPSPDEPAAFGSIAIPDEEGGTGYVVASYSAASVMRRVMSIGFFTPLGFLLFTAVMSVFIIRSINHSISRLEVATRKIAEGDLDFELDLRGSGSIASLTRSFDSMRDQLKDQFDRGSRFLMGLSHDLKTPLSSIVGYVDAIRDGHADSGERLEKYTSIIKTKAALLESRITALIDYAKQETREWEASLEPVELRSFLAEFVEIAEIEAVAKGHPFSRVVDVPEGMAVRMDPAMVTRALENVLDNAFRYASDRGAIGFDATATDETVVVVISNEGEGIADADRGHIFEPLFRASHGRNSPGFGLGLSTVRSVMTSHGWSIDVRSVAGETTRFVITIPIPGSGPRAT